MDDWSSTRRPGVALTGPDSPTRVVEWARVAEAAGLGSLWFIEDYFQPGAFSLAAAAAAATVRPLICLGVVNPFTRHPALLAMETAALSGVAPGRVVLGLGSSNRRWIEEQMGIPFASPLGAVRESVEIVRRLWRGERVTHRGRSFSLLDVQLDFAPAQPELPILLGVKGPRALAMAGEIADGVIASILSSPAHVRRARATARPAPGGTRFAMAAYVLTAIDDDGDRARRAIRPAIARYLGFLHGQSILADAGLTPADTTPFREALLAGTPAADLVGDDMVERLSVAGTPAECCATLARWADAGLDTPVAVVPRGLDVTEQIRRIGAVLRPFWEERVCR